MVEFDFSKRPLNLDTSDVLLVDFIDERFHIMNFSDSYVTASTAFKQLFGNDERFTRAFSRGESEEKRFREAAKKFRAVHPNTKIILHISRYATHGYVNGELTRLEDVSMIEKNNRLLEMYERIFIEEVRPTATLAPPPEYRIADDTHQWGLAPFHYVTDYYEFALDWLKKFIMN